MFNNNFNCFLNSTNKYVCISSDNGFLIYSVNPLKKLISRDIQGGVSIIKMLGESNIFLFSGKTDDGPYPSNKLIIWDDNKKTILGDILYNSKIQNIEVTLSHILVQVNKKIYLYQFDNISLLSHFDCNSNSSFVISSNILIYPTINTGEIAIVDIDKDISHNIKAHESNIQMISISNDGKYCATTSEKGTIIRLFDTSTYEMINEFRIGTEYSSIQQLTFHPNMNLLLVSSNKSNIQLFNTELDFDDISNNTPNNKKYQNYGINYVKFILPKYFHSKWSFSSYSIPNIQTLNIFDDKTNHIYTFGSDGYYYECSFDDINNPSILNKTKFIIDKET